MKRFSVFLFSIFVIIIFNSCVSTSTVITYPSNYITVGTTYEKLKGNEFYSGIGQTIKDKKGRSRNLAVAIQVDSNSGKIVQIVTMMPQYSEHSGRRIIGVGNFDTGLLLADFESHDKWLDAIETMQETFNKLYPNAEDLLNDSCDSDAQIYFGFDLWPWGPWFVPGPHPHPHHPF